MCDQPKSVELNDSDTAAEVRPSKKAKTIAEPEPEPAEPAAAAAPSAFGDSSVGGGT